MWGSPKRNDSRHTTPLPKPGKKRGPPANLWPIILLSILRKILTICLLRRVWDRLKDQIPLSQAAYQSYLKILKISKQRLTPSSKHPNKQAKNQRTSWEDHWDGLYNPSRHQARWLPISCPFSSTTLQKHWKIYNPSVVTQCPRTLTWSQTCTKTITTTSTGLGPVSI